MSKRFYLIIGLAGAAVVVGLALVLFLKDYPLSMSCDKAIDTVQAQEVWRDNQDTIRNLTDSHSAATGFSIELEKSRCPGKAFLHINYDTQETRTEIERALQKTPLKAIPVEWQNI